MSAPVAYRPARLFVVITVLVWLGFVAGSAWGLSSVGWMGPDLKLWVVTGVTAVLSVLALSHVYGAFLSGPSLVADAAGVIYRNGRTVWGPVAWDQVTEIGLSDIRGPATLHIVVRGPMRRRIVFGPGWVIRESHDNAGVLTIAPHSIDHRGDDAGAALSALHHAAVAGPRQTP